MRLERELDWGEALWRWYATDVPWIPPPITTIDFGFGVEVDIDIDIDRENDFVCLMVARVGRLRSFILLSERK